MEVFFLFLSLFLTPSSVCGGGCEVLVCVVCGCGVWCCGCVCVW